MTRSLALALVLAASGCSIERMAVDTMVPVFERSRDSLNREPVPRAVREAAPGLLATLEGLSLTSPDNAELRLLQAEMCGSFAFGFLDEEDPAWASFLYRKARAAALAALAQEDEDVAAELEGLSPDAIPSRLDDALDDDAVPALFWWAFARGAEINLNRADLSLVGHVGRADAVMSWVLARAPGFYNGGPHLYFAMRHCVLPPAFGGRPEEGLRHFQEVERLTGGKHLMARVLRAQFYAPFLAATPAGSSIERVLAAQRAAWDSFYGTLRGVIEAPADLWPEQALPNAVARERARRLLRDPEAHNIIPPPGVVNEFRAPADDEGWGEGGGDEEPAWDEGGGGQ